MISDLLCLHVLNKGLFLPCGLVLISTFNKMSKSLCLYVINVFFCPVFCIIGGNFIINGYLRARTTQKWLKNNGNSGPSSRPESDVEIKNLLIDLVLENPLIYDKSHPDHFLTNMRNEVWHNISGILSIPGKLYF